MPEPMLTARRRGRNQDGQESSRAFPACVIFVLAALTEVAKGEQSQQNSQADQSEEWDGEHKTRGDLYALLGSVAVIRVTACCERDYVAPKEAPK